MKREKTLLTILAIVCILASSAPMAFGTTHSPIRHLPILRNYFMNQCLKNYNPKIRTAFTLLPDGRLNTRKMMDITLGELLFIEKQVAWLANNYLKELEHRLVALKTQFQAVQEVRQSALVISPGDASSVKLTAKWMKSLKELEVQAKGLHEMLSRVLSGLKTKSDFEPVISEEAINTAFQKEIEYLKEQIGKADRRIMDYFFSPTHAVRAEDLQDENMMIYLYRVQKLSKELRNNIERDRLPGNPKARS